VDRDRNEVQDFDVNTCSGSACLKVVCKQDSKHMVKLAHLSVRRSSGLLLTPATHRDRTRCYTPCCLVRAS